MATLRIDKPELAGVLISQSLEKLPSTRSGRGYFIESSTKNIYINDIIANLGNADALGWRPYFEYPPAVGDSKRYEIARIIIDHHIGNQKIFVAAGWRLAKSEKDKFVHDILADFHIFGLFNQQKKELVCKIAEIITNKDEDTARENDCLKVAGVL